MTTNKMKKVLAAGLAGISLLASAAAFSATAVVVHPTNGNTLSEPEIARIFLGKSKSFPDGSEAIPVEQTEGSATRSAFVRTILKKNDQQIKAYWAQLLFTGKGTPPKQVGGGADVKKLVGQNPALIGYIDTSEVDSTVRVVLEF
ncbi:substrate-binding domain-containing protein [Pseudomaricurvus sp. HS19]|uniref:substrate-binding domain-containing protein n=1 Tax=Pseudomaricurvus sp. HS19 TaxID=2692626 RepID=UPI001372199A|nr:substrate-binding domain-containing protein [Pseudomaricurvus sp. HS19]MYM62787.1 phosphate ABC transporter substrate-binding protein [Pseudomaricurvus sp. HS19]